MDVNGLQSVLTACGKWDELKDNKLKALIDLLQKTHKNKKVLYLLSF